MMVVNVEPDIFVTGSTLSLFSFQAANSVYLIVHLPVVSQSKTFKISLLFPSSLFFQCRSIYLDPLLSTYFLKATFFQRNVDQRHCNEIPYHFKDYISKESIS